MSRLTHALAFASVLASCHATHRTANESDVASFTINQPSGVNGGADYDTIKVMSRVKTDQSYADWTELAAFTNIGASASLTDRKIAVTPGTYRINVLLLKAGKQVASGSETDKACLIGDTKLDKGDNKSVSIFVCNPNTTPPSNDQPAARSVSDGTNIKVDIKAVKPTTPNDTPPSAGKNADSNTVTWTNSSLLDQLNDTKNLSKTLESVPGSTDAEISVYTVTLPLRNESTQPLTNCKIYLNQNPQPSSQTFATFQGFLNGSSSTPIALDVGHEYSLNFYIREADAAIYRAKPDLLKTIFMSTECTEYQGDLGIK